MFRTAVLVFGAIVSQYVSCMTLADIPPNDPNHYDNPVSRELSRRLDKLVDVRAKDMKRIGDLVTMVTELEDLRAKDMRTMTGKIKELEDGYTKDRVEMTGRLTKLEHLIADNVQKMTDTKNDRGIDRRNEVKESEHLGISTTHDQTEREIDIDEQPIVAQPARKSKDADDTNISPLLNEDVTFLSRLSGFPTVDHARNRRAGSIVSTIAFSSRLDATITDPEIGETIVFDHIITNVGSNYNPHTGIFTCTQAGVHVFSWTIQKDNQLYLATILVRNGVLAAYASGGDKDTTGSATVAMGLAVGDRVGVRVSTRTTGADIFPFYTMFTGFRIQ